MPQIEIREIELLDGDVRVGPEPERRRADLQRRAPRVVGGDAVARGQRPVGAANYGLEKIDAGKIQIRHIVTTRQGVGSSPIDGQVFKDRQFFG